MRNFAHKKWTPDGPRPHVLARTGHRADTVADWLFARPRHGRAEPADDPLATWHPQWREIVAPIPSLSRHLTLGWVDLPTTQTPADGVARAGEALTAALAQFPVVTLAYTRVVASVHGIHLQVARTPELDQLARAVAAMLHSVFDPQVVRTPDLNTWVPHVALAYGIADADTPSLQIDLQPAHDPLDMIWCCEHDTWAHGWPQYKYSPSSATNIGVDIDADRAADRRLFYACHDDDAFGGLGSRRASEPLSSPLPPAAIRIG